MVVRGVHDARRHHDHHGARDHRDAHDSHGHRDVRTTQADIRDAWMKDPYEEDRDDLHLVRKADGLLQEDNGAAEKADHHGDAEGGHGEVAEEGDAEHLDENRYVKGHGTPCRCDVFQGDPCDPCRRDALIHLLAICTCRGLCSPWGLIDLFLHRESMVPWVFRVQYQEVHDHRQEDHVQVGAHDVLEQRARRARVRKQAIECN